MIVCFEEGHFIEIEVDDNGVNINLFDIDKNIVDKARFTPPSIWNKAEELKKTIENIAM